VRVRGPGVRPRDQADWHACQEHQGRGRPKQTSSSIAGASRSPDSAAQAKHTDGSGVPERPRDAK
jgi:hypothetical protein